MIRLHGRVRLGFALSMVCAAVLAISGEQVRFRSSADAVLVDVQVTAGGKPVTGLTEADFELRDSGVRQEIQVVSFADVPISLLLALDVSSSVAGEPLKQLKRAANTAVDTLKPGDQAALIAFGSRMQQQMEWSTDHATVRTAIDKLEANGWTLLHDTAFSAIAMGQRAAGRVVVLVFSDGADTASWLDAATVVESARRSDVVVTAVKASEASAGSGPGRRPPSGLAELKPEASYKRSAASSTQLLKRWFNADSTLFPYAFLERLTEETGGDLIVVDSGRDLANAFQQIVSDFKNRYLLTFTPTGVPASGWHPLDVRLTSRKAEVKTRLGYWR